MRERELPIMWEGPACGLAPAEMAVAGAAFRMVIDGRGAEGSELAEVTGLESGAVDAAVGSLVGKGQAIVDGRGRVVGSVGLSVAPTGHRIALRDRRLHAWCAVDAVGIAAALRADGVVATGCPACGRPIEVRVRAGRPVDAEEVLAWLPTRHACASVVDEACPHMSLFCHRGHLEEWRRLAGSPPGPALTLEETGVFGRRQWGPLV